MKSLMLVRCHGCYVTPLTFGVLSHPRPCVNPEGVRVERLSASWHKVLYSQAIFLPQVGCTEFIPRPYSCRIPKTNRPNFHCNC